MRKPTDKALVEKSIGILYSRVYVPLMEKAAFDSLQTLNQAIIGHVKAHNECLLQGRDYSREDRFFPLEKGALISLPHRAYHFKQYLHDT